LCRQVAQTLDEVFAECGDDLIRGLRVHDVQPAPDASRLLVTVQPVTEASESAERSSAVLDHLAKASGYLRSEVAAAVSRKHAPLLTYRLFLTGVQQTAQTQPPASA
jgi:ribosome-binding factor A